MFWTENGQAERPPRRYRANDLLQSGTDGNHPAAALELKWRRLLGAAASLSGTVPWRGQSLRAQQAPLHAARDDDHLAGDVAGELVGGEDDDLAGDVLGLGDLP